MLKCVCQEKCGFECVIRKFVRSPQNQTMLEIVNAVLWLLWTVRRCFSGFVVLLLYPHESFLYKGDCMCMLVTSKSRTGVSVKDFSRRHLHTMHAVAAHMHQAHVHCAHVPLESAAVGWAAVAGAAVTAQIVHHHTCVTLGHCRLCHS
jgi:hypothetical protein